MNKSEIIDPRKLQSGHLIISKRIEQENLGWSLEIYISILIKQLRPLFSMKDASVFRLLKDKSTL